MDKLKSILKGIVRSGNLDGSVACDYYDRLTKNKWEDRSLELYEDSLDKDEFVAHNTILVVFTDMDKERETQIKERGKKTMKIIKDDDTGRGIGNRSKKEEKVEKPFDKMTKKELQDSMAEKGIKFKKRDTNASLIKVLEKNLKITEAVKKVKAETNVPPEGKVTENKKKTEVTGQPEHDSMLKVRDPNKKDEKEDKRDLCAFVTEALSVKTTTLPIIMESVMILSRKLQKAGLGLVLIEHLKEVMPKDFNIWMVKNQAVLKEKSRKLDSITKVSGKKKDKETTKADKTDKVKEDNGIGAEEILEKLKGKKLTERILKNLPWRVLKKLAKQRNVESFGKSKKFITKRLLKK